MKKPPKSTNEVDDYISNAPKEHQGKLIEIRKIIKDVSPNSTESISYRMPAYDKGNLCWFALMKTHLGLYIRPPIIALNHKKLLKFKTSKSAIQFPLDEPIPVTLIKGLLKDRIKENKTTTVKFK